MSLELSSFFIVVFVCAFCSFNTSAEEAIPLITVKENAEKGEQQFVLNLDAVAEIKKLSSPVKVIAAIGDARVGKSTALNYIHYTLRSVGTSAFHTKNVEEIFKTGNTIEAVTRGVWISIIHGKRGMDNVILLDVEGTDLGDEAVTDKLSIFTALISSTLMLFMEKARSTHILEFLFKIVRLSELIYGEKESEHFPYLRAVVRGSLAPPKGYENIDEYVIDALVTPKWKDKLNEQRKAIRRRFPKERIAVSNLDLVPNPQTIFQSISELSSTGYLDAIETMTSKLTKSPEKKTLNGGLMDGKALAELAERLVRVMNNQQQWGRLNPNFYDLFEEEVCRKSEKEYIEPLLRLSSREIEKNRRKAFQRFESKCKLHHWLSDVDGVIQDTLERKRNSEERAIEDERRKRNSKLSLGYVFVIIFRGLGYVFGNIFGGLGYVFVIIFRGLGYVFGTIFGGLGYVFGKIFEGLGYVLGTRFGSLRYVLGTTFGGLGYVLDTILEGLGYVLGTIFRGLGCVWYNI